MASAKNSLIFLTAMVALFGVCFGTVYKVGDTKGWTNKGGVDYKEWASSKTFFVGDTIVFEYNPKEHSVVQVKTLADLKGCNSKDPLAVTSSGNDRIELNKGGHFFYICGLPGHCEVGQKVDIRVLEPSHSPSHSPESRSPSPSPAPSSNPSVPDSPASPNSPTSPKKSSAPSVQSSNVLFMIVAMAFGVLAYVA